MSVPGGTLSDVKDPGDELELAPGPWHNLVGLHMDERICAGCTKTLAPKTYRGAPRKWCSNSCRLRVYRETHERPVREPPPPISRVYIRDCSECGVCFVARGAIALACPGCYRVRRARIGRENYAANAEAQRRRSEAVRASRTEAEAQVESQRRRQWRDRVGRLESTRAAEQRRRALKAGATVERFTSREVFDRDGWRCGICSRAIAKAAKYPDPMSPSLDHVIPISQGGDHSRANTRASHLRCNVRRGARIESAEQLAML